MRSYVMYVCGTCGKESKYPKDVLICEAGHLGLTEEQYDEYRRLSAEVRKCGAACSNRKNQETEAAFDDAVEAQRAFEKNHGIQLAD